MFFLLLCLHSFHIFMFIFLFFFNFSSLNDELIERQFSILIFNYFLNSLFHIFQLLRNIAQCRNNVEEGGDAIMSLKLHVDESSVTYHAGGWLSGCDKEVG